MTDKFLNYFAKGMSMVFHPLLLPTYCFLFFSGLDNYEAARVAPVRYTLAFLFFVATFLIPGLMIMTLKTLGLVKSIKIPDRKERTLPFLLTAAIYYFVYRQFHHYGLPTTFILMLISATAMILIALFVNFRFKISIHLMGVGGVTGMIFSLSHIFPHQFFIPSMIIVGLSGLLGFARLQLGSHKPMEIYSGFLSGFLIFYLIFSLVPG